MLVTPTTEMITQVWYLYSGKNPTLQTLIPDLCDVYMQIASHRLSSQPHYDFAMRTLKSVLMIAAQVTWSGMGMGI